MFKIVKKQVQLGDAVLTLETGKIARQANSVVAQMGGTVVLAAVVVAPEAREDANFFPLTVNYKEGFYARGSFPGGFFKREGRPTEREVLTSRLIDRPIRPLFPEGFQNEVQVTCSVMSYDPEFQPDVVAIAATSAALAISGAPFDGPIGASRVGYDPIEGFMLNPSAERLAQNSMLDLIMAGNRDAVLMVESEAKELSEEIMLDAIMFGHRALQPILDAITEMCAEVGVKQSDFVSEDKADLAHAIDSMIGEQLKTAYKIADKQERYGVVDSLKALVKNTLVVGDAQPEKKVMGAFKELQSRIVRGLALEGMRIDGRKAEDIRQIEVEVDLMPGPHSTALFTRGGTQAVVFTTLGTGDDEQIVDDLEGLKKEKFTLHYNFPPYSVGETGRVGAPGRREIGHGKLAFRAIRPLLPKPSEFPYTMRVVSEITESDGSSSMASVCGASMSLMAAGVPLKGVAGIAMGLIKEGDQFVVLSDIMGDEDHLGDMDFKVAGTADGITALQMDIKINGITEAIMTVALQQALAGRKHILDRMSAAIAESRPEIVGNAPQIRSIQIPREKIGELIGPGGKMIKSIIEQTGAKIDISDDGRVNIAAMKSESMNAALEMVQEIVAMAEVGRVYRGKVVKLMDFGAFVAITKGSEGLVHVSEMALHPVKHPRDVLSEGQIIDVKVLEVDPKNGKIRLSMKALMNADASGEDAQDSDSDVAELTLEEGSAEAKKSGVKSMGAGTKKRMKKPAEGRDRDQQQEVDKDSVAKDKRRPDRSDSNTSSSNTNAGRKLRFF